MPNVVFFSFKETDREKVLTTKGRAVNSNYFNLNFRVRDLLKRWDTTHKPTIRQAISKELNGTSRTIVFVGDNTYKSYWVPEEVEMTLRENKPVYAIRVSDTNGKIPKTLADNGIRVYNWSEATLQNLATK